MKTKISVGLSKKIGQPNYGSCGASCHVEFDLDLLPGNKTSKFQNAVERAFGQCRLAVQQELLKNSSVTNGSTRLLKATPRQVAAIQAIVRRLHLDLELMLAPYEAATPEELSIESASRLIEHLNSLDRAPNRRSANRQSASV